MCSQCLLNQPFSTTCQMVCLKMLGPALGTSMVKTRLLFHGHRRQSERFGLPPPIFEKYVKLPG